ncbi:hypothetical protein DFH09DRAFT_1338106 [Mycena vulgaris]|nr:hypothetical protein DFH09DRAFT_1338106 [Mycena vulgaris]
MRSRANIIPYPPDVLRTPRPGSIIDCGRGAAHSRPLPARLVLVPPPPPPPPPSPVPLPSSASSAQAAPYMPATVPSSPHAIGPVFAFGGKGGGAQRAPHRRLYVRRRLLPPSHTTCVQPVSSSPPPLPRPRPAPASSTSCAPQLKPFPPFATGPALACRGGEEQRAVWEQEQTGAGVILGEGKGRVDRGITNGERESTRPMRKAVGLGTRDDWDVDQEGARVRVVCDATERS